MSYWDWIPKDLQQQIRFWIIELQIPEYREQHKLKYDPVIKQIEIAHCFVDEGRTDVEYVHNVNRTDFVRVERRKKNRSWKFFYRSRSSEHYHEVKDKRNDQL